MQVKFHRLDPAAALPAYQTPGSVAFDLSALEGCTVPPGQSLLVRTGLVVEVPAGFALVIAARSSLSLKKGLRLANSLGIIDQDYCGPADELHLLVQNFTDTPVQIQPGERLCQGMFVSISKAEFLETSSPHAEKSRGGFGSTSGYSA